MTPDSSQFNSELNQQARYSGDTDPPNFITDLPLRAFTTVIQNTGDRPQTMWYAVIGEYTGEFWRKPFSLQLEWSSSTHARPDSSAPSDGACLGAMQGFESAKSQCEKGSPEGVAGAQGPRPATECICLGSRFCGENETSEGTSRASIPYLVVHTSY